MSSCEITVQTKETTVQDILNAVEAGGWTSADSPATLFDAVRLLREYNEFKENVWNDDAFRENECEKLMREQCLPFLEKIRALGNPELETDFANIIDGIYELLVNESSKQYTEEFLTEQECIRIFEEYRRPKTDVEQE